MAPPAGAADPAIDILLATYNGAAYLDEQLTSIEAQTYASWRLIARDDGSTDRTPDILAAFQARHPERVTIIRDRDGNLGLVQNFSRLMEASTAPYAAFCDQDDVWLPEKLSLCLERMRELEAEHGSDTPLLVFTDLTVVDERLDVIAKSFWRYQRMNIGTGRTFCRLLATNVVTGCASLMNRVLLELLAPIPGGARVHDWWAALVAAGTGVLEPLHERTVSYRRHAAQNTGPRAASIVYLPHYGIKLVRDWNRYRTKTAALFTQANAFQDRFAAKLTDEERRALTHFLSIRGTNIAWRLYRALQAKCLPTSPLHALRFLLMS